MSFHGNSRARWNWLAIGAMMVAAGQCARLSTGEPAESTANDPKATFSKYKSWKPTTPKPFLVSGNTLCMPSDMSLPGPHGDRYIHVYVSDNARGLFVKGNPKQEPFPEGSVIVKEKQRKRSDDGPVELGVMIKRKRGSSPATGDWQYMFVKQDGELQSGKQLQTCAACHAHAKNDSVFGQALGNWVPDQK